MLPWTKKYQPESLGEVQGQNKAIEQMQAFVQDFKKAKKKALFLHGPTGNGKTSTVHALAKTIDAEIMEINASDFRNKDNINSIVGSAAAQMSLFMKPKIILVDEIDGVDGTKDRGGLAALAKVIEDSKHPIFLTGNNAFDKKFSTLRKRCELVEFHTLAYTSVFALLKRICEKEGIKYNEEALKSIARRAGGDLRGAISDLQMLAEHTKTLDSAAVEELSGRKQTESMLQALTKIFKTTDPAIAVTALDNVDEDLNKSMLWIDANLPLEYTNPEDLAKAYDALSRADVFKGRIRRWQYWRFLVYINALMTAGVAVAKKEKYKNFIAYKPTNRILKMWWAKQKTMKKKAIAQKIADKTHSSKKEVIKSVLPYYQHIFQNNEEMAEKLAEELDLDKDEIAWMKK